jgi:NAD(P)-dependent dehydrogenase (short-subunit alcohol dehydrogenase family)
MSEQLRGRVVVITGAARGMGLAYATAFLQRGARVVGLDRSWDQPLVRPASGEALSLTCDVTSESAVTEVHEQVVERFGTVDVLINNAALRQRDLFPPSGAGAILDSDDDMWQRMFAVNVFGPLHTIRHLVRPMIDQRRGSIINVSSIGSVGKPVEDGVWTGQNPTFRNQPYDAAKAALTSFSFHLAEELRPHNVAVNVLIPAGTRTTGSDEMVAGRLAVGQRMGPLLRPEHVVPLALHLAVQDASGDTGRAWEAVAWNRRHGFGGPEAWRAEAEAGESRAGL